MEIYHLYSINLIYGQARLILTEIQSENECINKSISFLIFSLSFSRFLISDSHLRFLLKPT